MSQYASIPGVLVDGTFRDEDTSRTGLCRIRRGTQGDNVLFEHIARSPRLLPFTGTAFRSFDGYPDPGTMCFFQPAYPGASFGYTVGGLGAFNQHANPPPGTIDWTEKNSTAPNALDPIDQPLPNTQAQQPPKEEDREGVKVQRPQYNKPYIPREQTLSYKPYYGGSPNEKEPKWEQRTQIPTAETPFTSLMNKSMLSNLPGQVLSLAKTFSNLTSQQLSRIQSAVDADVFNIIQSVMSDTNDIGDHQQFSLVSRVHPETFAENMTNLLCECTSYADILNALQELRTNPELQGKDKLQTVEFKTKSAHGPTGIIIDAYGVATPNISSKVAQAEAEFSKFLTQGVDNFDVVSAFYGDVRGNVLTVNIMSYGDIKAGKDYLLEGDDITDGSYIVRNETGRGNTGTYILNIPSQTEIANTKMFLYKVETNPEQSSGGGGGGGLGNLIGMIPGQNMFGEAAKLIAETLPTLSPDAAQRAQKLLQEIQKQTNKAQGDMMVFDKPLDAFKSFVKKIATS